MNAMINAVLTLSILVGLWWVLFGRYGEYHAERFEQAMAEIRHRMHSWAHHRNVPLEHPAYQMLRNTMIGMTRLGLRLTLLSFIWNRDTRPSAFARRLQEASISLDERGSARLLHYRQEMNLVAFKYFMLSPPILMMVIPPLLGLLVIKYVPLTVVSFFESAFDRLDDRALAKGMELEDISSEDSWRTAAAALGAPFA